MAALTLVLAVVLIAWLTLLTVAMLRWRQRQGEPVYRRLPGGRLRFEWSVSRAYETARRHGAARQTQTGPIPAVTPPAGIGSSTQ